MRARFALPLLRRAALLAAAGALAASAAAQPLSADPRPRSAEPAFPTTGGPIIASHRGMRASKQFDQRVHDRRGNVLGTIDDIVVDMCNGEVRHAVIAIDGGRRVKAPVGSITGGLERLVLSLDAGSVTRLPAAQARVEPAWVAGADCARAVSAHRLINRNLFDTRDLLDIDGKAIGKLADLVISMNRARVHFAVVAFDPDPGPADTLLAFPIQLFRLHPDGRLVLPMTTAYLKTLDGFIESGWSHMLSPDELADLDRQFIADFPAIWDHSPRTLFEHLDRDQSDALSREEARLSDRVRGHFDALDQDRDRRVSKPEFVRNYPRVAAR